MSQALPRFLLFAVCILAGGARAQSVPPGSSSRQVQLRYALAEGAACADVAGFRALVSARLGYEPFVVSAPLTAEVTFALTADRIAGRLVLSQAGQEVGRRELEAASDECGAVAESLAMALAIAVDPQVLKRTPMKPSPLPPPPRTEATVVRTTQLPAEPSVPWNWSVWVGGGLGLGMSARPSAVLPLEVRARRGAFSISLLAEASLAPTASLPQGRVETYFLRGGTSLCGHVGVLGICGKATAGAMRVAGDGFDAPAQTLVPQAALGPVLQLEFHLASWMAIKFHLGAEVTFVRTTISVANSTLWRAPPFAMVAGVELGWGSP